ncbi:glycosyl hydrolases family 28 [Diplonema papillatum]|nr:glycosyl hydrolases family 28 [Diplonema papillatum]
MFRSAVFALLCVEACHAVVNVESCGAVGDATADNTNAFRECAAKAPMDDGILLVPGGTYRTGAFNLSSNTILEVMGAIRAVQSLDAFPVIPPLPSYGTSRDCCVNRYQALIQTNNAQNITIRGPGSIDGGGEFWWPQFKNKTLLNGRPKLIELINTTDIEITGVTLQNPGFWTLHPVYCKNVWIHHIRINNPADIGNTDGIDPDSSANVLIEHNSISCGDDVIAMKSGMDQPGRDVGIPLTNVTIRHNVFYAGVSVSIGSEVSGGVSDIFIYNNTLVGPLAFGAYLKSAPSRGGYIKNVLFQDHRIGEIKQTHLVIQTDYDSAPPAPQMTVFENIRFVNVTRISTNSAAAPGTLNCFASPDECTGVSLDHVHLGATSGSWDCKNVKGISLTDVSPSGLTCS